MSCLTLSVQGNNTAFPTDARLYKKVIDCCNKIADTEDIPQADLYQNKQHLLRMTYNSNHQRRKKAVSAMRAHTLAGRQVRELEG